LNTYPESSVYIAKSDSVSEKIPTDFSVAHIGNGSEREIFLRKPNSLPLPNRFAMKRVENFTFDTSELVNIVLYENSIATSDPATTYVYRKGSDGFQDQGPWLTSGKTTSGETTSYINGLLITEYKGQQDKRLGVGLKEGERFTLPDIAWTNASDSSPNFVDTSSEITVTFGVVEET
jgi:hypothetical protein